MGWYTETIKLLARKCTTPLATFNPSSPAVTQMMLWFFSRRGSIGNRTALISAHEFFAYHQLDVGFIVALEGQSMLEIITIGPVRYLHSDQLEPLERLIRLHRELAVHVEDLDIVAHLLERSEKAQVNQLQNRLAFFAPTSEI